LGESHTLATSVTGFQSNSRFWREVRRWRTNWEFANDFKIQSTRLEYAHNEAWYGMHQTWNENRPEAFQGLHAEHVMHILDEASAIPDEILQTIASGATDPHVIILYLSNPTRVKGRFREAFRERRESWITWNIDARNVDIVSKESIAAQLDE